MSAVDTMTERLAETWEEAAFMAYLDHALLVGQEVVVPWLFNSDGWDVFGSFTVRLLPTRRNDLDNRCYEYLDPCWDIEPVCEDSRQVFSKAKKNGQFIWTGGPSYRILEEGERE